MLSLISRASLLILSFGLYLNAELAYSRSNPLMTSTPILVPSPVATPTIKPNFYVIKIQRPIVEGNVRTKQVLDFSTSSNVASVEFHDNSACTHMLATSNSVSEKGSVTLPYALNRTISIKLISKLGKMISCSVLYRMSNFTIDPLTLKNYETIEPTYSARISTWGDDWPPFEPMVHLFSSADCNKRSKIVSGSLDQFYKFGVVVDFKSRGTFPVYFKTSSRYMESEWCLKLTDVIIKGVSSPIARRELSSTAENLVLSFNNVLPYVSTIKIFANICTQENLLTTKSLTGAAATNLSATQVKVSVPRPNKYSNSVKALYVSNTGLQSECVQIESFQDITGRSRIALDAKLDSADGKGLKINIERVTGGPVTIYRKTLEQTGFGTPIATLSSFQSDTFVDFDAKKGLKYEYGISQDQFNSKVVSIALEASVKSSEGTIVLVVDKTLRAELTESLMAYSRALNMDGWNVKVIEGERQVDSKLYGEADDIDSSNNKTNADNIAKIRGQLLALKNTRGLNLKAVLLIGHLPIPMSGTGAYDGHPDHRGAWPTDSYYTSFDKAWTDKANVSEYFRKPFLYRQGTDWEYPAWQTTHSRNLPDDGKFDEQYLPGESAFQIGRLDFWSTEFKSTGGNFEVEQIQRYFLKNIAYRKGLMPVTKMASYYEVGGFPSGMLQSENDPRNIYPSSQVNLGTIGWDSTANNYKYSGVEYTSMNPVLFFEGRGWGWYTSCAGNSFSGYYYESSNKSYSIINSLFGSYFGDWYYPNNLLRSSIGSASADPVSAGHWGLISTYSQYHQYQRLLLGETYGEMVRASLSKQTYVPFQFKQTPAQFTVLGDPTLKTNIVPAVQYLQARTRTDDSVVVSWEPSSDSSVTSYIVYRSRNIEGPYSRVAETYGTTLVDDRDPVSKGYKYYIVKAKKLEKTLAGSFWNLSSGTLAPAQSFISEK